MITFVGGLDSRWKKTDKVWRLIMTKNFPGTFTKTQKWYKLPLPKAKACCSEGSTYYVHLKKGASNKLMVFFGGGGISWNEYSASKPITIPRLLTGQAAFYFPKIGLQELMKDGLLAGNDKYNPFNDWNFILLPYATGDFHVGNNDFAYTDKKGKRRILRHYGARNVTASLEAVKNLFPSPVQLLIAGESAGAFGCIAQAAHVVGFFPDCNNITVFSDSGQISYPKWKETARDIWKADRELWECIQTNTLNLDWFRLLYNKLGNRVNYLNYCSYHDGLLSQFQKKMNHDIFKLDKPGLEEFHVDLAKTQKALLQEIPGFHCYISGLHKNKKNDSTSHTASRYKSLYTKNNEGISLAAWLDDAVNNGKFYNVGLDLL
jgi:hypothetical protein